MVWTTTFHSLTSSAISNRSKIVILQRHGLKEEVYRWAERALTLAKTRYREVNDGKALTDFDLSAGRSQAQNYSSMEQAKRVWTGCSHHHWPMRRILLSLPSFWI